MHKKFLRTYVFASVLTCCGTASYGVFLADLEAYDAALTKGYTLQRSGAHNDVTIDVKSAKYPKGVYHYKCTHCQRVRSYSGPDVSGACTKSPEVPTQTNIRELELMRDRMAPTPDPRKRGTPEWWRANLPERWTPEWPAKKSELVAELMTESTAATNADLVMLKGTIAKLQAEKEQAALAIQEEQKRSAQLTQKLAEKDNFLGLLSLAASSAAPSIDHYQCLLEFCGLSAEQYQSLSIDRRLSYLAKYHKFIVEKTLGDISESDSDVDDSQSSDSSPPHSLPLPPFRTAVDIYNYKSASTWLMRLGIINATNLAYRLGAGEILGQPAQISDINADLSQNYWRTCRAGSFTTGVYSATDISSLQSRGSFIVAANFDANGCSDEYSKILIAFHGMRVNSKVVTKSIVKDDITTASKLITRSLREKPSFKDLPIELTAHLGFLDAADSAFAEVDNCITNVLAGKPLSHVQLIVTGHSMGGAIGSITSIGLLNKLRKTTGNSNFDGINARNNVVLLTMGQPRVWGKAPWDAATVQAILSSPVTGVLKGLGKSARELVAGNARKVDSIMRGENNLRIVTAYDSTKKAVYWKHDFVAQIPPALTLGYKHTKKEQRAFLPEHLKEAGKFAHDLSKYYKPCMLADGEAK